MDHPWANYSPPSDDSDSDSDDGKAKRPSAKRRAKKDPNAPERPMNSYMMYATAVRAQIMEANPDLRMGDIAKEISLQYKNLGADEKAKLQKKVNATNEVYKKQMAEYENTQRGETQEEAKDQSSGKQEEEEEES